MISEMLVVVVVVVVIGRLVGKVSVAGRADDEIVARVPERADDHGVHDE